MPIMRVGNTMRARPPAVMAALVVTLPTRVWRGGQKSEARPEMKRARPTR